MHMPKYLMRLIVYTLLMSTLPVIFLGTFSYFTASSNILDKVTDSMQQLLAQTQSTVEENLRIMDQSLTQLTNSPVIIKASSMPLKPEEFQTIREVNQSMENIAAGIPGIQGLYFINTKNRWAISPEKIAPLSNNELNAFTKMKEQLAAEPLLLEHNSRSQLQMRDAQVPYGLLLVKANPHYVTDANSLVFSVIDYEQMNRWITDSRHLGNIFIVNQQNQVIASNSEDREKYKPLESMVSNMKLTTDYTGKFFKANLQGKSVYVFYHASAYTHWTYLSVIPKSVMLKDNSSILWTTLLSVAGVIGLMLVLSYKGSLRMYSPINHLYNTLTKDKPVHYHKDEIDFIAKTLANMKQQMMLQGKELHKYYVLKLFYGELLTKDIHEKIVLNHPFFEDSRQYSVLAIKIDTFGGTRFSETDRDLLLFAAVNIVEETIPFTIRLSPVVVNQTLACLLSLNPNSKELNKKVLLELGEAVKTNISRYLDFSVSVGISRVFHEMPLAPNALHEGLEALKYRVKFGNNALLFIEDVEPVSNQALFRYPEILSTQLQDAIKLNDSAKAHELIKDFVHALFQLEGTPADYQIILIRLLSELTKPYHFENTHTLSILEDQSLPKELLEMQTASEIEDWFINKVIDPILKLIEEKTDQEYKKISDEMVNCMIENDGADLTLDALGKKLNYSPAYLSQVFRKEKGVSFTDYVTAKRIHTAKIMLIETDYSVNVIAQHLNFTNPQNFIRSFKREVGMTPGKYREMNNSQ